MQKQGKFGQIRSCPKARNRFRTTASSSSIWKNNSVSSLTRKCLFGPVVITIYLIEE